MDPESPLPERQGTGPEDKPRLRTIFDGFKRPPPAEAPVAAPVVDETPAWADTEHVAAVPLDEQEKAQAEGVAPAWTAAIKTGRGQILLARVRGLPTWALVVLAVLLPLLVAGTIALAIRLLAAFPHLLMLMVIAWYAYAYLKKSRK